MGSLSEAKIQPAIFNPLLDCLADNKPKQLGQLVQVLKNQKITAAQVLQAVLLLSGSGALQCAQDEAAIQSARKKTDALNQYLMQKARSNAEINYLASPVTGGVFQYRAFTSFSYWVANNISSLSRFLLESWHSLSGKYYLHRVNVSPKRVNRWRRRKRIWLS